MITINNANEADLRTLPGIGPLRARRIIEHRRNIGPIRDPGTLALASGLSLRQVTAIEAQIDWSTSDREHGAFLPTVAYLACAVILLTSLTSLPFSPAGPAALLLIVTIGLFILACAGALLAQLLSFRGLTGPDNLSLVLPPATAGLVLLLALAFVGLSGDLDDHTGAQLAATGAMLVMALVMFALLLFPSRHFHRRNPRTTVALAGMESGVLLYEVLQVPMAALILALVLFSETLIGLEEIFALWLAVVIASNGFEQINGRPSYITMLDRQDVAWLQFLAGHNRSFGEGLPGLRMVGVALLVLAFNLAIVSGLRWFRDVGG